MLPSEYLQLAQAHLAAREPADIRLVAECCDCGVVEPGIPATWVLRIEKLIVAGSDAYWPCPNCHKGLRVA